MIIAPELLAEKNYAGSRLILVKEPKVYDLQNELSTLQKEINPILDKLSKEYYPKVDPLYQKVQALTLEAKTLREEIAKITTEYRADTESIETTEQKASLIKNKMSPLIMAEIDPQLGEFEIARHTKVQPDGQIYVEVFDEIEEKVKAVRHSKANKTKPAEGTAPEATPATQA